MPRAGLAAGNADGGCAGRRLPQLRQRIYRPDGLAGLLFEPADQVRYPHRGDGYAAHVGRALYLSGGYGTYSVKPGRGAYQRVGSLGAPRERHRGRGHETAGHVLLQPAGGVPGLFRDARLETPRGHRVLEETTPETGRRSRVGQGCRQLQALYAIRQGHCRRRRRRVVLLRHAAGRAGRGAHGRFVRVGRERPPEPRSRAAGALVRRHSRGRTPHVERRLGAHPRRGRYRSAEEGLLYGALPCADPPQRAERRQRRIPRDGERRDPHGRGQPLYGLLAVGYLPQPAPAADAGLPRTPTGDGALDGRHVPGVGLAPQVGTLRP